MSNEAKTTKAYKISPELKEKLERLAAESGLETQEAFIEQMAALYELQRLKEGNGSGYVKQIEELEYHSRRSVELVLGVIETEAAARLQQTQTHEEKQSAAAAELFAAQQEIADLKKEAKAQSEELVRISKELEAQTKLVEQLEAAARDKGLIVEQYREKVDTLSGLVNEYKEAADANKELISKVSELTSLTEKQAARVADLEDDITAREAVGVEQLRQAEERRQADIERLTERKDVERERELLALRTELQEKQSAAAEAATAEIRKLYAQIEQLREIHALEIRKLQQPSKDQDGDKPKNSRN